jgi:hypothetical protein
MKAKRTAAQQQRIDALRKLGPIQRLGLLREKFLAGTATPEEREEFDQLTASARGLNPAVLED